MRTEPTVTAPVPLGDSVRFGRDGRFWLQPRERRLLVDGAPAALGARAFDMLVCLAERAGKLVTKHELLDLVWPGLVVEENNLAAQISSLRKVLGADVIATVPGRGYRFVPNVADAPATVASVETAAEPHAPAPAPVKLRTNLPATLTPLVGRSEDLAALHALVDRHRLVVIVGAGGMGKTLIAQHLLLQRAERYVHGVCWVDLAANADVAALPAVVAAALDVQLAGGQPLDALAAAVAGLDLLVVLDNAEHLLDGVAALVQRLLDAAPLLTVVVTSQVPLRLAHERVFRIDALSVPNGPLPAEEALAFGSVALFAERARQADARFALSAAAVDGVIAICRALDGLPLAIELAAARAPALGVGRIAGAMEAERLRLLTSTRNRAAPPRQQTLRAALDWSHALLEERDRIALRRLAVMEGTFDAALAQRVVADAALDEWQALDALASLVERSFVAAVPSDSEDGVRYRLLDSPRSYAREKLDAAGETDAVKRRHAEAMLDRLRSVDVAIGRTVQRRVYAADVDNARAALAWFRASDDDVRVVEAASILEWIWPAAAIEERRKIAAEIEARVREEHPPDVRFRAFAALMLLNAGSSVRAALFAREAVRAARETTDATFLIRALLLLIDATGAADPDDTATVVAALDEARALTDAAFDADAVAHRTLASILQHAEARLAEAAGDRASALAKHRRVVELAEALDVALSSSAVALVDVAVGLGRFDDAIADARRLIDRHRASRDVDGLGILRLNLCAALCGKGDFAEARAVAETHWGDAVRHGHDAWWTDYLARVAAAEGRPRAAARIAGWSEATYRRREDVRQKNEVAAWEAARSIARAALGAEAAERLEAEGAGLSTAELARIAFARSEAD